jgi:histone H3/H4
MAEQLVTISKVKEVISSADMRTDGSLPDALNGCVRDLLHGAASRARENGRKTVRPDDLGGRGVANPASVTVASRVRGVIGSSDLRVDGSLPDAVNGHVHAMLQEAIGRARANGRSTVRPYDLPRIR